MDIDMTGRASKELAEALSAGADEEFERVLKALTKVVEDAATEYRSVSGPRPDTPHGRVSGQAAKTLRENLMEQIRRQTVRAAS
jgi:predicted RNA binding protein with dsRBD fold (UPF0201 family)